MRTIIDIDLRYQEDVLFVMKLVRKYTAALKFNTLKATKMTTALSEVCRNAFQYAKGGTVSFMVDATRKPNLFVVRVADEGAGIENLQEILDGTYTSSSGMGVGLKGSQKLVDYFDIKTSSSGTTVELGIPLPPQITVDSKAIAEWRKITEAERQFSPLQELKKQNQQLAEAYEIIRFKENALEKANNKLQYLVGQLSQKNEELEEFAHIVAHDLKSPLNVVFMAVEMAINIYSDDLTPEVSDVFDKVRGSAERMKRLINDMLEYATASVAADKKEKLDIGEQLQEVLEFIDPPERVTIHAGKLPEVYYDRVALKQVIQNFLTNAIKYCDKDEVMVNISYYEEQNHYILAFRDNGPGIKLDDQEKVFKLFQTLGHKSNADSSTGIGLSVIKKIAERNGGDVWIKSNPEKKEGTTFFYSILKEGAAEEASVSNPQQKSDNTNQGFLFVDLREPTNS